MRRALLVLALAAAAWSPRAQAQDADLAFMESGRPERRCLCDSLDDWVACVADAPALAARGALNAEALVASIATEADRHLERECLPAGRQGRHRLCFAAMQLREIALGAEPTAAFLATDIHGEPQVDAPNDEWRQFLEGSLGGPSPGPSPSPPASLSPEAAAFFRNQQQPRPGTGNRVAAGDALRRGGSPQTGGTVPADAVNRMCTTVQTNTDSTWAGCIPMVCSCPSSPTITVTTVDGSPLVVSPEQVCQTISYGLGDLIDKVGRAQGGATAMLTLLGMTASILEAIANNAVPILCGYARNSVYISDECINEYSATECQGARLALECLGCGNSGNKECSARCLCFWQALAKYNEERRAREGWACRNFGIRCPDERGYFYRLGVSCLNPPPGGIRNGGYR